MVDSNQEVRMTHVEVMFKVTIRTKEGIDNFFICAKNLVEAKKMAKKQSNAVISVLPVRR